VSKGWNGKGEATHIDDIAYYADEHGYDGVIVDNVRDNFDNDSTGHIGSVYIVFNPNQIKSITNTNPTNSNNINEDAIDDLKNDLDREKQERENVKKEFESMSSNDIINLLGIPNKNDIDTSSPMFILPNGAIISVAQAGSLIGEDLDSNIHSDMIYVILLAIAKKCGYDCDPFNRNYEESKLDYLTYGLDWARINCGQTWLEDRFYCVLPNHMTSSQYRSLEKWLEWGTDNGKKEVLVYVGRDEVNQTYYFDETLPEDIIKKIKRYYSSGRLYENRNELKENMSNKLTPQQAAQAVKDLKLNSNPNINVYIDEFMQGVVVTFEGVLDGGKKITLWESNILSTQEQIDNLSDMYQRQCDELERLRAVGYKGIKESNELGQKPLTHKDYTPTSISNKLKKAGFIKSKKVTGDISRQQDMLRVNGLVNGEGYIVKGGRRYIEVHYCKGYDNQIDKIYDYLQSLGYDVEKYGSYPGEYCVVRYPEEFNESMTNELEQRAKKHKKKSKGMGWHMAFNAGDVEKGMEVFNSAVSVNTGASNAMSESAKQDTYHYEGPIYYRGHKIAETSDIYTTAKSINMAVRNTLVKAAQGADDLYNYDIVDNMVKLASPDELKPVRPRCQQCGYELNDIGDCPVCDYGEDDLLESLSDLEALWTLNNLD
jgi:hypothetical protein